MRLTRWLSLGVILLAVVTASAGFFYRWDWSLLSWLLLPLPLGIAVMQVALMILSQREIGRIKKKTNLAFAYSLINL